MPKMFEVPENLLMGRRAVDGLAGVDLLEDWQWNSWQSSWFLKCALTINSDHRHVPPKSIWYIVADPIYPEGDIEFFPSKIGGITTTFQHQSNNNEGSPDLPWRNGNICLHSELHRVGQLNITDEPLDNPHLRLKWRFERALVWLSAAAKDDLAKLGDPFELPHVPVSGRSDGTILFLEDSSSFALWDRLDIHKGFVELAAPNQESQVVFPISFTSMAGNELFRPRWGKCVSGKERLSFQGFWFLLQQPPILPVWHIPNNWKELKAVLTEHGISIAECLKPIKRQLKRESVIFLIGFPITDQIGNAFSQIHWMAIQLPSSAAPKKKKTTKAKYVDHYEKNYMPDNGDVPWLTSDNCHYSRVSVRGRLSEAVVENEILVIGLGAIGSMVVEQLSRAGQSKIALMDQDIFAAGNMVRHTLGLESVAKRKSHAICNRLLSISPHLHVDVIDESFPPKKESSIEAIRKYPVIIDCTADRKVRRELMGFNWADDKLFITIALGFKAQRLYFFSAVEDAFPFEVFDDLIRPWIEKEKPEYVDSGFPREGIGCWHPIFPARVDDIWMLTSAAIKQLEKTILSPPERPQLTIFKQLIENGDFIGINKLVNVQK